MERLHLPKAVQRCGITAFATHTATDTMSNVTMSCVALLPHVPSQDPSAPGPMLTSALQKSNSLTLKLYHKTPAALAVTNATAAAMRRYVHAQQQKRQAPLPSVAAGRGVFVVAAATADAAAVGAGAAADRDSGLDELQVMLVRQRLAALVAWRDAAARAGKGHVTKGLRRLGSASQ
jgi:hypothetical protein